MAFDSSSLTPRQRLYLALIDEVAFKLPTRDPLNPEVRPLAKLEIPPPCVMENYPPVLFEMSTLKFAVKDTFLDSI